MAVPLHSDGIDCALNHSKLPLLPWFELRLGVLFFLESCTASFAGLGVHRDSMFLDAIDFDQLANKFRFLRLST